MASSANKFAAALRRNTNRMTLALVYALLEWILIALLLANSLFSFLILSFADYFGLHPPCPLCSSLEHLFRPGRERMVTLCRDHLEGISGGQKPTGWEDASEDRSSPPVHFGKQVSENGFASQIGCPSDGWCQRQRNVHPPDYSSDDRDSQRKVSSTKIDVWDEWEKEEDDEWEEFRTVDDGMTEARKKFQADDEKEDLLSPKSKSSGIISVVSHEFDKEDLVKEEKPGGTVEHDKNVITTVNGSLFSQPDQISSGLSRRNDESFRTIPRHLEFYIGNDESELIPVDLKERYTVGTDDRHNFAGDVILELCLAVEKQCEAAPLESAPISFPETEATGLHQHSQNHPAIAPEEKETEGMESSQDKDSDVEVSIGTEIPDHETVDEVFVPEGLPSFEGNRENTSTSYDLLQNEPRNVDDSVCVQSETETLEFKTIVVEMCEVGPSHLQRMCKDRELNQDTEEDKIPNTPASTDSLNAVHSMEGCLVGYIEGEEEDPTIEQLKEALKEERRSLHALYAELEEERNASAIAASQTMAMINRLQEEKAAMQMEAVQYQRMMEEQSEYDQEALQLLNDLVVKTEKEKEKLARELNVYRQRIEGYEARENMITPGRNVVLRNSEYREAEGMDENDSTPCDAVACLEESLEDFEEERLCILEHIKSLEEKLVSVTKDEDSPQFEDVQAVASCPENGNVDSNHVMNSEVGGNVSKNRRNGILGSGRAKRLLPLLDETADEDDGELQQNYEDEQGKTEHEDEQVAVEEELDYVYERLDALEADGEFLRHCMGSLKKGDKGLDMLREILQYLRDMRSFRD